MTAFAIPAGVSNLHNSVLKSTKITTIHIPANVEVIGDGAFANTPLATITFEEGDKPLTIGTLTNANTTNGVFYGTKIQIFEVPDRVTRIGAYAFYNQKVLTTLTMGPNSQVTDIGKYAFGGTSSTKLANLTLGPKLKNIYPYAFARIAVTTITIPKSVELVDEYAFNYASATEVVFEGGGTEALIVKKYAFGYMSKLKTITLPARLQEIYETTSLT